MSRAGKLGLESTPSISQLPFPFCPLPQPVLPDLYESIPLVQQSGSGSLSRGSPELETMSRMSTQTPAVPLTVD